MQRYIRLPLAEDATESLCGTCPHARQLDYDESAKRAEPDEPIGTAVWVCLAFRQGILSRRLQVLRNVREDVPFDLARLRECRASETVELSLEQVRALAAQAR